MLAIHTRAVIRNASFVPQRKSRHIHVQIAFGVPMLSVAAFRYSTPHSKHRPSRTRKSTNSVSLHVMHDGVTNITCASGALQAPPKIATATMMPTHSCVLVGGHASTSTSSEALIDTPGEITSRSPYSSSPSHRHCVTSRSSGRCDEDLLCLR